MNRRAVHVVVVALALAGIGTLASTAQGVDGDQCLFNDDCTAPMVCSARRCRVECRSDRDCSPGSRCHIDTALAARNRCALIPPAPPATGFIVGRVDVTPGVPLTRCTVDLGVASSLASCDGRGEFILPNVPAGRYEVRIRPSINDGPARTIIAYVDPGMHSSVGTVTISPHQDANGYAATGYNSGIGIVPVIVAPVPKGAAPSPSPKK